MRITKIDIKNFGPLSLKNPIEPGDFTLVWGLNEKGKTLVIEAILCGLPLDVSEKGFDKKIFRTSCNEGVIIELEENGKIYSNALKRLLKLNLNKSEIYNLFFVVNSSLSYTKDEEVFRSALDRLSSTYIDILQSVKKKLLEMNKLTETLSLKNTQADNYLADRYERAKQTLPKIEHLLKEIESKNYEELEYIAGEVKRELEKVMKIEEGLKRKKSEKLAERTGELINLYFDYKSRNEMYRNYTEEALDNYRKLHKDLEDVIKEIETIKEKDLKSLEEKISSLTQNLVNLNKIKSEIQRIEQTEKLLSEKIVEYKLKLPDYEKNVKNKKLMQILYIISGLLFVGFLGASTILKNNLLFIVAFLFFALTSLFVYLYSKALGFVKDFILLKNEIFDRAKSVGFKSSEVEGLSEEIERVKNELVEKEKELDGLNKEKETLEQVKKQKEEELKNLERKRGEIEAKIEVENERFEIKSLNEFEEKLKEKKSNESKMREFFKELEGLWHDEISDYQDENDFFAKLQERLRNLRMQRGEEEPLGDYGLQNLEEVEEKRKKLIQVKEEVEKSLQSLRAEFAKIENEVQNILYSPIDVKSISDLIECKKSLENFIEEQEKRINLSKILVKILDGEIERSKNRFNDLFSDLTQTSEFFELITGGRYKSIRYDLGARTIKAEDRNGNVIGVSKLSGGTIDQLFFAIRLGLGIKVLEGRSGFFVFDDPFVKSDHERLRRELDLLVKISKEGWQILYFSCKEEVKNYLLERYSNYVKFVDLNENSILAHEI